MPSIKKTKRVFAAKKEVTKSDAKYLKNLLSWRLEENKRIRWSDNWFIFSFGVLFGILLGMIV